MEQPEDRSPGIWPIHCHTLACQTHRVAVHKLLLRQGHQLPTLDGIDTLDGARGGKGPAAATGGLVLDGSHCTLFAPVHRCWRADIAVAKGAWGLLATAGIKGAASVPGV